MTGRDYINYAKKAFYPVETYVTDADLSVFLNVARQKVIKYAKIGYKETVLSLLGQTPSYTLSENLLEVYSAILQWDSTIRYSLNPIPLGRYALSTSTFFAPPWKYTFLPPNKVYFYPCPDRSYDVYLYGVPFPLKTYDLNNLGEEDTDITTTNYLEPVAILIASQIARFDQNYELADYFEKLFIESMRVAKV